MASEVRVIENRGRDVSSLLIGVRDVIDDYDIACFVHDKKTAQVVPGTAGAGFAYKCLKNTLASREFEIFIVNLMKSPDWDCFHRRNLTMVHSLPHWEENGEEVINW